MAETLDRRTPPAARPLQRVHFPQHSLQHLTNGIPVYYLPWGQEELCEIHIFFPAGRSFEPASYLAPLTAEMLTEGTLNRSGLEFAQKMDECGALLNCDAGYETAGLEVITLTRTLPQVMPLLAEMLLHPRFPEEEFEQLRQRSLQRLDLEEQKTAYIANRQFNACTFGPDHPYGRYVTHAHLAAAQLSQLREYHAKNWNLVNATILIAGRFDTAQVHALLEQYLGAPALVNAAARVDVSASRAAGMQLLNKTGLHYYEKQDSVQASLRVGHAAPPRMHPDFHGMQVVMTILGGYFGSRLMRNIREDKGYTYGVHAAWQCRKYGGAFLIQTEVGNEYITPAIAEMEKEIRLLIEEGVKAEELDLVRNYLMGRGLSGRETTSQLCEVFTTALVNGVPLDKLDERFDVLLSLQPQDIRELAARHLHPDALVKVVCGKH